MRPPYNPGDPVGLHHILADWISERALPASIMPNDKDGWWIIGESHLSAEIDGQVVIGWQPAFTLNAGDPEFFDKLEEQILDAERHPVIKDLLKAARE